MSRVYEMYHLPPFDEESDVNKGLSWVEILANRAPGGHEQVMVWRNLPFIVVTKWNWYFEYRAALYKIQHPRLFVIIRKGWEKATDELSELLALQNGLPSMKGQVTKAKNDYAAYAQVLENYRQKHLKKYPLAALMPVEQDKQYQLMLESYENGAQKILAKERQLQEREARILELKKITNRL